MRLSQSFLAACFTLIFGSLAWASPFAIFEGGATWQTLNDVRIPGDGGTDFSLTDFTQGPVPSYRLYLGYTWEDRHEVRFLYAPLSVRASSPLDQETSFAGETFAEGVDTDSLYQFNSYRLTYAYHFEPKGEWRWALGFTAKIRDAEIRLEQGSLRASKTDLGFVPLLHFRGERELCPSWNFRFDLDGLAAPQGRAFDLGVFFEKELERSWADQPTRLFFGYRTVEGGADNDRVYNFAWLHSAVVGLRWGGIAN